MRHDATHCELVDRLFSAKRCVVEEKKNKLSTEYKVKFIKY